MSHTVWCPKVECQHPAQVSENEDGLGIGQCPACGFAFCTRCEATYHGSTECHPEKDAVNDDANGSEEISQSGKDLEELERVVMKRGTMTARKMLEQRVKGRYL